MNNEEFLRFAEKAINEWVELMDSLGYLDLLKGENKYEDIPKLMENHDKNDIL